MARLDIGGTWVGQYGYDEDFPDDVPPPVAFTLTARPGWFGRFRGTVRDDPAAGVPDEAAVRGWVTETTVEFRKQYPVFYMQLRGERVTLREYMEELNGVSIDRDVPPKPIHYRGEYDPVRGAFAGAWRIPGGPVWLSSNGRSLRLEFPECTGVWAMRRDHG